MSKRRIAVAEPARPIQEAASALLDAWSRLEACRLRGYPADERDWFYWKKFDPLIEGIVKASLSQPPRSGRQGWTKKRISDKRGRLLKKPVVVR